MFNHHIAPSWAILQANPSLKAIYCLKTIPSLTYAGMIMLDIDEQMKLCVKSGNARWATRNEIEAFIQNVTHESKRRTQMEDHYTLDQIEQAILTALDRGKYANVMLVQNQKNRTARGKPISDETFIAAIKYHLGVTLVNVYSSKKPIEKPISDEE